MNFEMQKTLNTESIQLKLKTGILKIENNFEIKKNYRQDIKTDKPITTKLFMLI